MSAARPALHRLARRLGVVERYHDLGGVLREASDEAREGVLAAMGRDGASEASAQATLDALEHEARMRVLEPVRLWREHDWDPPTTLVRTPFEGGTAQARLELVEESGRRHERELALLLGRGGAACVLALPVRPPPGLHELRLELELGGTRLAARQTLLVAPRSALGVRERLGGRGAFGVSTNLWSVRSATNLGHGDLGDLGRLCELVGAAGGDFVATSPLHCVRNRGLAIGPYSPVSRFLRNPLLLDLHAIPELERCEEARARLRSPALAARLAAWRAAELLEHEPLAREQAALLAALHRCFAAEQRARPDERGADFARFREREGELLESLATFLVLLELQEERGAGCDWRRWPAELRDPRSPAVARVRREQAERVERELWIQFELERQLAQASARGARAGLRVGLIDDLAVGAPHDSADAWALGATLAQGAELGAPPDAFTADGQAWGLAPFDPLRLRATGYAPWVRLLRGAMRHAGALRIDHVLGLFRAFWIPAGLDAARGVYVRQPSDELLALLALESRRQACLVLGEDLGVVPDEVPRELASWGVLSTRVLLFEREGADFRAPARLSARAFLSATTHDLVPLRGFVEGADLTLRAELGVLPEAARESARAERAREVEALTRFAARASSEHAAAGAGDAAAPAAGTRAWVARLHAALAASPAPLVAYALDDLAGEREPVNLPGVPIERHRSWSRRMRLPLEELAFAPPERAARARS